MTDSIEHNAATRRPILITGARRGIGFAIAQRLHDGGGQVVLTARTDEQAEELRGRVDGWAAQALALDLNCSEQIARVVAQVRPAAVIHAATTFPAFGKVQDLSDQDLDDILSVKVGSALRLAREALPHLARAGHGRMIFIGSRASQLGVPGQAAYAAANAALLGIARSLAAEVGRSGVTVNVVSPGLIETERVEQAVDPRIRSQIVERTPVGRIGWPADIAAAIAFLVSPEASFITGVEIPVDGGLGLGTPGVDFDSTST